MAPPSLRQPVTRAKENRSAADAPLTAKSTKEASGPRPAPRRPALGERSEPNRAAAPRTATKPGAPSQCAARTSPRSARGAPDPWAEVRSATAEADKLEAELASLEEELRGLETEAREAEAREAQAEEQLTSQSASMLSEYATAYERFKSLEEQLRAVREGLGARRKENLDLSRQNVELDKRARLVQEQIAKASAELERCTRSQGELEAEVAEGLRACEAERLSAEAQSQRLSRDLKRFSAMKAKLQELLLASDRPQEVWQLIAEAEALMQRTQAALQDSLQVAEHGIVPEVEEESEEEGDEVAQPAPAD